MSESDNKVVAKGPEDILQSWLDTELRKLQESPQHSIEEMQAAVEALRRAAPSAIDQLRQQRGRPHESERVEGERGSQDHLTGVGNRRGVEDRLAIEWERSRRYGRPLTVVALEVSQPNAAGDDNAQDAGDTALRSVASRLVETLRASDFLGRIVGEEFVLICPEVDEEGARAVTTKVLDVITGGGSGAGEGRDRSLKVSAGWATRAEAQTAEELLRHADRALYGRDDAVRETSPGRPSEPTEPKQPRDEHAERAAHYKWMERV